MPQINVLIVEDNPAHQKITEYILKKNNIPVTIFVVRDGQEILDYLYRREPYTDIQKYPIPDIILLDLNMPKRDGREVLKIIKEDSALQKIPIVVVSTSDRVEDVSYARRMGVVGYISKSIGFDKLNEELSGILKYLEQ
jgi:CheY-like chemotaxis protein